MNLLVLILARKGSKRLKGKNMMLIKKKSLISHTIDFAKKIVKKDRILLFTDDKKIQNLGKKKNIIFKIKRPKRLSLDKTNPSETSLYAIKKYNEIFKKKIDSVVLLQPTTPFRKVSTFKKCLKIFKRNVNLPLIGVAKIKKNISEKLDQYCLNKISQQVNNKYLKNAFQFKSKNYYYFVNGSYYFISLKKLKSKKSYISKNFLKYFIKNTKENLDIDSVEDLNLARNLL